MNNGRKHMFDIDTIPLDDEKTYKLLQRGDSHGVFQLETWGGQKVLKAIQPTSILDIAVAVAVNRPGPLKGGVLEQYAQNKKHPEDIIYLFPELEPILAETHGTLIYQEQVMQIAVVLAGYSLGDADSFRESIGKKDKDKMAIELPKFFKRAIALGHDKDKLQQLVDLIEPFAQYSFNKSHAVCYAILAYQTAYLRSNFPLEFQCALLNMRSTDKDKLPLALRDAREHNIEVLGPDIHKSQDVFTLEGDSIRFGLLAVKDFGTTAYATLATEREKRPFVSLDDMLMRCNLGKLNSKALKALI